MRGIPLVLALILILPELALATPIPNYGPSWVVLEGEGPVVIVPGGSGPSLAAQGVVLHVYVVDEYVNPIPNYPLEDIWTDDVGTGDIALCRFGSWADADTDEEGHTTISGPVAGGGWTQSGMSVYLSGVAIQISPEGGGTHLDLDVNSPDINGDRAIDLSDIGIFSGDLVVYHFRSDFNHDGATDLNDISLFSGWLADSARCP